MFRWLARLFRRQPVAAPPPSEDDEILESLDRLQAAIVGKVPNMVVARVDRVAGVVRETVPRLGNLSLIHI